MIPQRRRQSSAGPLKTVHLADLGLLSRPPPSSPSRPLSPHGYTALLRQSSISVKYLHYRGGQILGSRERSSWSVLSQEAVRNAIKRGALVEVATVSLKYTYLAENTPRVVSPSRMLRIMASSDWGARHRMTLLPSPVHTISEMPPVFVQHTQLRTTSIHIINIGLRLDFAASAKNLKRIVWNVTHSDRAPPAQYLNRGIYFPKLPEDCRLVIRLIHRKIMQGEAVSQDSMNNRTKLLEAMASALYDCMKKHTKLEVWLVDNLPSNWVPFSPTRSQNTVQPFSRGTSAGPFIQRAMWQQYLRAKAGVAQGYRTWESISRRIKIMGEAGYQGRIPSRDWNDETLSAEELFERV